MDPDPNPANLLRTLFVRTKKWGFGQFFDLDPDPKLTSGWIRIQNLAGSIGQKLGSADLDPGPDPHLNVMDPQHCTKDKKAFRIYKTVEIKVYTDP